MVTIEQLREWAIAKGFEDDIFYRRVLHPDGSVTVEPRPKEQIESWLDGWGKEADNVHG